MADSTAFEKSSVQGFVEGVDVDGERDILDDAKLEVISLGDLNDGDVITEAGLARLLRRHQSSVKRACERGELPPPTRLCGQPVWTVRIIRDHIEDRLMREAKDAERTRKRIEAQSP
jgi:hypothetical protein